MMLADARGMLPKLVCLPADPEGEAQTLTDITDWCRRFTPLAALDAPDGVMLDVTGAAHLFGGEEKLRAEVEARLAAQGFSARVALAPTAEAAWAVARFGRGCGLPAILPDWEEKEEKEIMRRLGRLPLAALQLSDDTLAALAQAGLRRIDDLLLRPRAPLAARFGSALFARLDGLLGRAKHPISPRFEAPLYLTERRFSETILRREDVEASILALAQDLAQLLTRHGEGARSLDLSLFRVDGIVTHIEVGLSRPSRDPQMMTRLFREKIEALCLESEADPLDAGFGFDVVRLSALAVERLDPAQPHWLLGDDGENDLADLIDRLGARLGMRRVMRFAFADTHSPEFAVAAVPASSFAPPKILPLSGKECLPQRPLRLLARPEPIETIASVPDGPPLRFRWRRVLHEIAAIEGPERIAPEWWKDKVEMTRDYFRAEDLDGRRFWLFREGLYEAETLAPRWFMHGLFA